MLVKRIGYVVFGLLLRLVFYDSGDSVCVFGVIGVGTFLGDRVYSFDWVPSAGRSGGLLSIWDPQVFILERVFKSSNYLLVSGTMKGSGGYYHLLNVYSPHNLVHKRLLWEEIRGLIGDGDGRWIVAGDFNAVRSEDERRNSIFNVAEASFNDFIDSSNLHEYSLKGRRFTFVAGNKLSRIDRIRLYLMRARHRYTLLKRYEPLPNVRKLP